MPEGLLCNVNVRDLKILMCVRPSVRECVRTILDQRCVSCHSSRPTDDVFRVAPKGIMFDNNERVHALANLIKIQTVTTIAMPLGNKTGMTHEERVILGRWVDEGASIK